MKKKIKRVLSLILCLVILCCPFANIGTSAHAFVPAIGWAASEGVFYVMSAVFAILGIHFASKGEMVEAANQFLIDNPIIKSYLEDKLTDQTSSVFQIGSDMKLKIWTSGYLYLQKTLIPTVSEYFSKYGVVQVPTGDYRYNTTLDYTGLTFTTPISVYNNCPYSYLSNDVVTVSVNGVTRAYQIKKYTYPDSGIYNYTIYCNNTAIAIPTNSGTYDEMRFPSSANFYQSYNIGTQENGSIKSLIDVRFGFQNRNGTIFPMMAISWLDTVGVVHYSAIANISTVYNSTHKIIIINQYVTDKTAPINYDYVIDYSLSEVKNALQKIIDELTITGVPSKEIPIEQEQTDVVEGKQEAENEVEGKPYIPDWAMWWEKLGIKDLVKTVTESKSVTESDVKLPNLPVSIKDKFPFCVPFDLYYMIQKLNATGVAPSWNIPFKIQSLGINLTIPLDLSGWESVAVVCRWAFTLMFILALVLLTRNIIRA